MRSARFWIKRNNLAVKKLEWPAVSNPHQATGSMEPVPAIPAPVRPLAEEPHESIHNPTRMGPADIRRAAMRTTRQRLSLPRVVVLQRLELFSQPGFGTYIQVVFQTVVEAVWVLRHSFVLMEAYHAESADEGIAKLCSNRPPPAC
jgi:hypothetical protein